MAGQPGFFDGNERLKALSAAGDPLEQLSQVIDFEEFRSDLEAALSRSDRAQGGRPPYDAVLMFKVLVLQTLYTVSDDQTEYQRKDRLSFMRFCRTWSCMTRCPTTRRSGCIASSWRVPARRNGCLLGSAHC
jgi:IS5 family transposase